MIEKYKVDKLDIALNRNSRLAIDFAMDFFTVYYGLKTLAQKQINAMVQSLEELYRIKHPYGVFFCRLLNLYHPRPIPTNLSVFLMAVNELFNSCCFGIKTNTFAQNYEIVQYGGQASIVDVMELVMKICKNNRKTGENIIFSIHKDCENSLEIILMKVCGTLLKTKMKPNKIFELLDQNSKGNLDYQEFVDGIRYTLNI